MTLTSIGMFTDESRNAEKVREKLASIGMEWFHQCQNERTRQERQWYLNLAFFYGNQYVKFRQQSDKFDLYVPPAPYYKVRATINQVRKIVRKEVARLTSQQPNAFVVPSSTEDADVFAAQAAEQIWGSLWRRLKFNKVLREAVFWQATCGNGFIKHFWDSTKKEHSSSEIWGDISIKAETPFHIFVPELLETEVEEQPYLIHAQIRNKSWVKQYLGVDITNQNLDSVDEGLLNVMGVSRLNNKKEQAIVLEVWVKPGFIGDLPDGGMFTIAANQVVQGFDSWPYSHGQYPVTKLDGIPTGKFYNTAIIEDLIPLQRELNRTRSQIIEAKNRMAKPQLTAQQGSINPKRITTEPGQIIEYKLGFDPPQPLPMQGLPSYVTEEVNRIYTDMADISGQHEVSKGQVPPGVTAATAISFLSEQDESLISNHYDSIEEGVEKVAAQCLSYVKDYWDEERTVKVTGLEGVFDVLTFKGSDLKGNTDIRVESGSALPTSRAAKQAFISDLMKMGFIDPQEGLEVMEIGGLNKIYERTQVDRRQAQRENLKMRTVKEEDMQAHMEQWTLRSEELQKDAETGLRLDPPLIIPVHTYDNHQIHINEHNLYRKSQAFENADELTKIIFEEHVRSHEEALVNIMSQHPLAGTDSSEEEMGIPEEEEAPPGPVPFEEGTEELP
jgi:hypothetical protein